jgi:hypothetical protein
VAQGVGPEFKPQYQQNNNKNPQALLDNEYDKKKGV